MIKLKVQFPFLFIKMWRANSVRQEVQQVLQTNPNGVYTVWCIVKGEKKGCVVIDLKPLNRTAVPDVYPLSL